MAAVNPRGRDEHHLSGIQKCRRRIDVMLDRQGIVMNLKRCFSSADAVATNGLRENRCKRLRGKPQQKLRLSQAQAQAQAKAEVTIWKQDCGECRLHSARDWLVPTSRRIQYSPASLNAAAHHIPNAANN